MRRVRGKRRGEAAEAGVLVAGVLKKRGVEGELRAHRLIARWRDVVGDRIAARSLPDGLHRGMLWVRVDSSAWMHQLSFLRKEVIEKANAVVGEPPLVSDVRFHLGGRRDAPHDDLLAPLLAIRRDPARERSLPPPATGEQLAAIEREASQIQDEELRNIVVDVRRRLAT
jgi:hypothetical protein